MHDDIAIIGGGYAGLSAAVELSAAGRHVTLFEASRILGGRARRVVLDGVDLDNGQHILIGAYAATLGLMQRIGLDPDTQLQRRPLELHFPEGFRLAVAPWPAPLHLGLGLLQAQGLSWRHKWAVMRFMLAIKAQGFRLATDMTVASLLKQHAQPDTACRYLWEPLCISALNTPAAEASAQIFLNVLRDSLAAERAASDFLLPRTDLSALLPEAAADFVCQHGGEIRCGTAVKSLVATQTGYRLNDDAHYRQVIVAVAPYHLAALLQHLPHLQTEKHMLEALQWQPITSCFLRYPASVRLPGPMFGYSHGPMQWLFDRGQIDGKAGWLAAVISAHGAHESLSREALAASIEKQIAEAFPHLPAAETRHLICERRATFACTPGLQRPQEKTSQPGLWLAGDYLDSDYPATLEAAVRSGRAAARRLLQGN